MSGSASAEYDVPDDAPMALSQSGTSQTESDDQDFLDPRKIWG